MLAERSYFQHCTYTEVVILQLWNKYLPNSELSFIVSDAACAERHRISFEQQGTGKLYVGDPADSTFLKTTVDGQAGKFDVIIDDGKASAAYTSALSACVSPYRPVAQSLPPSLHPFQAALC